MSDTPVNIEIVQAKVQRGIWKGLLSILFIIGLLWLVAEKVFQEDWTLSLDRIHWPTLLLGWTFMVGTMGILGLRWRILLPTTTASRSFFAATLSSGLLVNYALPGPMGEIMGAWLLEKEDQTPLSIGITSSMLARLIGLLTAALGAIGLWSFVTVDIPSVQWLLQLLIFGIAAGALLLILLMRGAKPFHQWSLQKDTDHPIRQVSAAFLSLTQLSFLQISQAFFYSALGHGTAFLGVWISLQALGTEPSATDIAFAYLVGTCCGTVAFLFPGSQFTWDAIFIGLLTSTAGYDIAAATGAVAILRIEQIAMMLFGAIPLIWLLWKQRLAEAPSNGTQQT